MSKEDELKNLREKEEQNEGLWSGLSPEEFLEQMFIRTDPDGILYVPGFNASTAFCAEDFNYRCKMKWSYSDYERVLREYREIVAMLNALRAKEDRLGSPLAEQLDVLNEAERRFWNTYLRPFSNADDWESGIADISECVDIVDDVRILSESAERANRSRTSSAVICGIIWTSAFRRRKRKRSNGFMTSGSGKQSSAWAATSTRII